MKHVCETAEEAKSLCEQIQQVSWKVVRYTNVVTIVFAAILTACEI